MSFGPIFTASCLEMMQYKGIFLLNGKTKNHTFQTIYKKWIHKISLQQKLEADNKFLRSLKEVTQSHQVYDLGCPV